MQEWLKGNFVENNIPTRQTEVCQNRSSILTSIGIILFAYIILSVGSYLLIELVQATQRFHATLKVVILFLDIVGDSNATPAPYHLFTFIVIAIPLIYLATSSCPKLLLAIISLIVGWCAIACCFFAPNLLDIFLPNFSVDSRDYLFWASISLHAFIVLAQTLTILIADKNFFNNQVIILSARETHLH